MKTHRYTNTQTQKQAQQLLSKVTNFLPLRELGVVDLGNTGAPHRLRLVIIRKENALLVV